jgi:pyruvate,orthophosphate dikinase
MSKKKTASGKKERKTGKYVFLFGKSKTDGNGGMKPCWAAKVGLAEMCRIGLPVPPSPSPRKSAPTTTNTSARTRRPSEADAGRPGVDRKADWQKFGDVKDPLLVSVRSGARDSMPGMMDTILNLGLNDQTVEALAKKTGNPRFAWDCYRRFVQMYGDVVLGVQKRPDEDHEPFETVIEKLKHDRYHRDIEDTKLTPEDLKELVVRFKALVKDRAGKDFPASPWDQLMGAVGAVFGSWMNDRAIVYRRKYNIPSEWGGGERAGDGTATRRGRVGRRCAQPRERRQGVLGEFLILHKATSSPASDRGNRWRS